MTTSLMLSTIIRLTIGLTIELIADYPLPLEWGSSHSGDRAGCSRRLNHTDSGLQSVRWRFVSQEAGGLSITSSDSADSVSLARAYPDGGGFNRKWQGSGTPREIRFSGKQLLAKGDGTYCCGFTFTVAMDIAESRDLLTGRSFEEIRRFQKDWYGVLPESKERLCVLAVERLKIGRAVDHAEARSGDMLQFWRTDKSGHSVIFLSWVVEDGQKVGIRFRSSQPATNGIGDAVEYFSDANKSERGIVRGRAYFCRLEAGS